MRQGVHLSSWLCTLDWQRGTYPLIGETWAMWLPHSSIMQPKGFYNLDEDEISGILPNLMVCW